MLHWNLARRRIVIFSQLLVLGSFCLALIKLSDSEIVATRSELEILERVKLPLKEISGIDWRKSENGLELLAIGDRKSVLAIYKLEKKETQLVDLSPLLMKNFSLCQNKRHRTCAKALKLLNSDWESLNVDNEGAVYLLQEHSESILKFDAELKKILGVVNFDLLEGYSKSIKKSSGKFHMNSLGEGLLLMGDRFWIAKELFPAALVEVAPLGRPWVGSQKDQPSRQPVAVKDKETYSVKGQWELAGNSKCDFSDLGHFQGKILILSQKCRQLYIFNSLPEKSKRLVPHKVLDLPKEIKAPEALTVLPNGHLVIASDNKKITTNTFVLKYAGWNSN